MPTGRLLIEAGHRGDDRRKGIHRFVAVTTTGVGANHEAGMRLTGEVRTGMAVGLTFAMVLGLVEAPAPADATQPGQAVQLSVPMAPTPVTVAGAARLVYELHVANAGREPLVLQSVLVLDGDGATVLADVRGDDLDGRLARPGTAAADPGPRTIGPATNRVVYLELTLGDGAMPRVLDHRVTFQVAGRQPAVGRGARVAVGTDRPVALGPPLRGGPWAAVYDPSWERGHRRVFYTVNGRARIPGRFAIDWMKVARDGSLARGDQDSVSNWHGYGAPVLAVADAVVAAVRDDMAESATVSGNPRPRPEDGSGNYVALDLGGGRYAFYEHLKPGSITVEPGAPVRRGQVIGSLGFTGSSTGPHLHFHVAGANSPLGAEGLPFLLDGFELLGRYDDFAGFGKAPWDPLDRATPSRRTGERPAPNVVIAFPEGT